MGAARWGARYRGGVRDSTVVSGRTTRERTVSLAGIRPNETERCLAPACGDGKDGA
jgi:hypothetical protein